MQNGLSKSHFDEIGTRKDATAQDTGAGKSINEGSENIITYLYTRIPVEGKY